MDTRFLPTGLILAAVSGCAVGPNYQPPDVAVPPTWSGVTPSGSAATQPTTMPTTQPARVADWWKSLNDPMLDSLLARAVESNLDLRFATAVVREARALRGVAVADFWPQVNLSSQYSYSGSSLNTSPKIKGAPSPIRQARDTAISTAARSLISGQGIDPASVASSVLNQVVSNQIDRRLGGEGAKSSRDRNLFQAGFDAGWELDVFGGIRREVEAADADLAASVENHRDVLVTLLSEVAFNYVQLRGSQRRLVIARDNIRAQQDSVELTQMRYKAGFTNELDVSQARTQLASTQSQVPLLETSIKESIFQLSILLARPPADLLQELEADGPIPAIPPEIPVGLPSDLLRRRPDIRSAERALAAATARIGVATADLFPRFSLTGSFGSQTRDIRHLLDRNSLAWSVGPQIYWPILDGWRIRSNIEVQDARQEQQLAEYEKTVLIAFQEVEQALVAYTNEQIRRRSLAEAVSASQRSAELSNELYSRGLAAFLNVLESQRALYATQDELVQSDTTVVTNLIALYKALGGGWQTPEG